MNKKIESPLTETAFLILLSMIKPNYGYGVQQFVEEKTKGRVIFGPGTLYGAINNLAKKGLIKSLPIKEGERKKEYILTDLGRENLKNEIKRLEESLKIVEEIKREGSL